MTIDLESAGSGDGELLMLADAKAYLRVTGTDEDGVIADLIASAEAACQGYIGRPFTAVASTDYPVVGRNATGFGVKHWPVSSSATVLVLDHDGSDVTSIFDINYATGRFVTSRIIGTGQYTVTYTGGMSLAPTWDRDRMRLTGSIRDLVAEWYANRDPGASSVADGDMSRVTVASKRGIPPRVISVWDPFVGW